MVDTLQGLASVLLVSFATLLVTLRVRRFIARMVESTIFNFAANWLAASAIATVFGGAVMLSVRGTDSEFALGLFLVSLMLVGLLLAIASVLAITSLVFDTSTNTTLGSDRIINGGKSTVSPRSVP